MDREDAQEIRSLVQAIKELVKSIGDMAESNHMLAHALLAAAQQEEAVDEEVEGIGLYLSGKAS